MGLFDRFRSTARVLAGAGNRSGGTGEQDALRLIDEGNAIEQEGRIAEALERYESAIRLAPNLPRAHLNRGNVLLQKGDAEGALEAYATALVKDPYYAGAHYNMGNAYVRAGRRVEALAAYRRAIALKPDFADAEVALGSALEDLGHLEDAVASYRRALTITPDYAEVHSNLGHTLMKLRRLDDALASYRRSLALDPRRAEVHNSLGLALQVHGRPEDAVASFRQAVAIDPEYAEAHSNLGDALHGIGLLQDALACSRRALELRPDSAEAHSNLGNALKDLGQFDEAIVSLRRAMAINCSIATIHFNLGNVLQDIGKLHDATKSFRRAIAIDPGYADAHCNLGNALYGIGLLHDALGCYRRTLELKPDHVLAHNNIGNTLSDLGCGDEAVVSYREALKIDPDFDKAQSNLLFSLNYRADQSAVTMLDEARHYGDLVARKARPFTDWGNVPDPDRRLRVGFVSGDLRDHVVGYFVEGVLAALATTASDRPEIFAYPNHFSTDAVAERIKACCHGWHPAVGLSDERLADRIRGDRIDILIDLSGHTTLNRLAMFAWKPAPVQATWLGYFATTGVAAIDYLIADPWTLPESEEVSFTEKIWRLPETRLCFTQPEIGVEVAPLPALRNGYITFGSFNRLTKMNDSVVALWAKVLFAVPDSRLLLKSVLFNETLVRQDVIGRFGAHGITGQRLILEGPDILNDFLAAYGRVDIAFDPFPYTGGGTSVHALWMGVPVLTLAGDRFVSRQGVSLLMNARLPDWIAVDAQDYVARAVEQAGDTLRLASLRQGLRKQVLSSPIFDTDRFANHLAPALRGMWREWCHRRQGLTLTNQGTPSQQPITTTDSNLQAANRATK